MFGTVKSIYDQFFSCLAFFTRLPVGWSKFEYVPLGKCIWAFPLVGGLIGFMGALAFYGASYIGFSGLVQDQNSLAWGAGFCALVTMILLTGALHEDGLADFADGLGGKDKKQALKIMRDSAIGTYGVLALLMSFGGRLIAFSYLVQPSFSNVCETGCFSFLSFASYFILIEALSRSAIIPLMLMNPVQKNGRAKDAGMITHRQLFLFISFLLILLFMFAWLLYFPPFHMLFYVVLGGLVASLFSLYVEKRFGGITGDMLGALEQIYKLLAYGAYFVVLKLAV